MHVEKKKLAMHRKLTIVIGYEKLISQKIIILKIGESPNILRSEKKRQKCLILKGGVSIYIFYS